jgi:hypothetical protein
MSMNAADIYRDCLIVANEGNPLYQPELDERLPVDSAYEEYRSQGIGIGDVCIIGAGGNFDFLFNICKAAPTSNPNATPNANNLVEEHRGTAPIEPSRSARSGSLSLRGATGGRTLPGHGDEPIVLGFFLSPLTVLETNMGLWRLLKIGPLLALWPARQHLSSSTLEKLG